MKNKILILLSCILLVILVGGLGSALLCMGSNGYYEDCGNNADLYHKKPVKTAVQNYNTGYYTGYQKGVGSGYSKGYDNGYTKGKSVIKKKTVSRSSSVIYLSSRRSYNYPSYYSYGYSSPSYYSYSYPSYSYVGYSRSYSYPRLGYQYVGSSYNRLGGYGYGYGGGGYGYGSGRYSYGLGRYGW